MLFIQELRDRHVLDDRERNARDYIDYSKSAYAVIVCGRIPWFTPEPTRREYADAIRAHDSEHDFNRDFFLLSPRTNKPRRLKPISMPPQQRGLMHDITAQVFAERRRREQHQHQAENTDNHNNS
eukprot:TRINITY_DN54995_c0_g1_i1.p3 TRINITY_DN54995_c0_g1~~TRINITY_DN54995_c0_g1_i1.p3  ORF type:complete len:125 (+),score=55.22 TRINITY_DN54995_c0_g1_i1:552-926(+)